MLRDIAIDAAREGAEIDNETIHVVRVDSSDNEGWFLTNDLALVPNAVDVVTIEPRHASR